MNVTTDSVALAALIVLGVLGIEAFLKVRKWVDLHRTPPGGSRPV
jgi:hypothetical protein